MDDLSFIINELGEDREAYFRAVAPPIMQTSNFAFNSVEAFRKSFEDEYSTWLYSRGLNPTVDILRKKLAALDGAEDCLVFNSGAAAIFAAVIANVQSGDHVICVKEPYTWARKLFDEILPRFNVSTTFIDGTDINNFTREIKQNTTLIYLESPNSWSYEIQDLQAVAVLASKYNIVTIIDNSYCTSLFQKPLAFGIDLTIQTATKYISGHSDTVAGVLCGSRNRIEKIFNSEYMNIGSGIQPFNAWLLIRGLRTLPLRLDRIRRSTEIVMAYLQKCPYVEKILFPFNADFPQRELAHKQMQGAFGLLTFIFKTDNIDKIEKFCNSLQHILMAVSWGGYESLVLPKCAGIQKEEFNHENLEHRMIRLYVGLEEPDYIIQDLAQAFEAVG